MSPQRLYSDSQMFLRGGEAGTKIRGHGSNTTQTKKCCSWTLVFLQHTPLCLLCGSWQSHVRTKTEGDLCACYRSLSRGETFKKKCLDGILKTFSYGPESSSLAFSGLICCLCLFEPSLQQNLVSLVYVHKGQSVSEQSLVESDSVKCSLTLCFYWRCSLSEADMTWHQDCHLLMS